MKSDYKKNSDTLQFLSILRAKEIYISIDKEELVINSKNPISPEIIGQLREKKAELITYLVSLNAETKEDIARVAESDEYPVSYSQRRFWILDQLTEGSIAYNMTSSYVFEGELDIDGLDYAFERLIARHESLRTVFRTGRDEEVAQIVLKLEESNVRVAKIDLRNEDSFDEYIKKEIELPFNLSDGPLIRVSLFQVSEQKWVLTYVIHHIVGDGWSLSVIISDLMKFYSDHIHGSSSEIPPLSLNYKDYAIWQQQKIASEDGVKSKLYWETLFTGEIPKIELPTDFPRPPVKTFSGNSFELTIENSLSEEIQKFCKQEAVTLYMFFLAAFKIILNRYTHQDKIIVGSPIAGREHHQLENQVGPYLNLIPVFSTISKEETFLEFLGHMKELILENFKHSDYPFDKLIEDLNLQHDPSRNPLFDVLFSVQNLEGVSGNETYDLGSLIIQNYSDYEEKGSKFDLSLYVEENGSSISLKWEYNTDLFNQETIFGLSDHFNNLLRSIISNPKEKLIDIPILSTTEEDEVLRLFNNTDQEINNQTITALFDEQVEKTPERVAVVFEENEYSYQELNVCANRLADYLREKHALNENQLVGLKLERSEWIIIAILALLKSGASYVPIDVSYPEDRVNFIRENSGLRFIFDEDELASFKLVNRNFSEANPETSITAESSAYVIYTSGSTGKPKGVEVSHGNAVNFFKGMKNVFGEKEGTLLAVTNYTFDISILELMWTLTQGYKVVIQGESRDIMGDGSRANEKKALDFSLFYFGNSSSSEDSNKYKFLMEGAKFADANNFAAVWTPERHFHEFGGLYPNPSVLAAAISSITEHIDVRAGSVVAPLHHPLRIAEEWSVVDNLSNGRAGIAFASGWQANDFVLNKENFQNRHQILFETIDVVKQLWSGGSVNLEDGNGTIRETSIFPNPIQKELPIWVTSAGNVETFRSAGKKGLNVLTHLLGETIESLEIKIKAYREEYAKNNHPEGKGKVTLMLHTYIGESDEDVIEKAKKPFINYLKTSAGLVKNLAQSAGIDMDAVSFTDKDMEDLLNYSYERYVKTASLIGTEENCSERLAKISTIGVDEIACLIDFGIDYETTFNGLNRLQRLKESYNSEKFVSTDYSVASQIRKHKVTHIQSTPSLARLLMEMVENSALESIQTLILGGERLPEELVNAVFSKMPDIELYNMYGPTETTIWSAYDRVKRLQPVTIGRPIINTQIYILDENQKPVPKGVEGEIYIGGSGVSKGYVNNTDLTTSFFSTNPFSPEDKMYRTGDYGRWLRDGRIELKGRKDDQLKISGYRIELGEIENALSEFEAIENAIVLYDNTKQALVAFYMANRPVEAVELKRFLTGLLPLYMIPNHFNQKESFPLMINGKVNRKQLLDSISIDHEIDFVEPTSKLEIELASIWKEILNIPQVGIQNNFFELGGNSIRSIQMISRINQSFSIKLGIQSVFDDPTIESIAAKISFLIRKKEMKNNNKNLVEIEL